MKREIRITIKREQEICIEGTELEIREKLEKLWGGIISDEEFNDNLWLFECIVDNYGSDDWKTTAEDYDIERD